jgi:hypothetical protein
MWRRIVSDYEIADHPYDQGYFDAVKGRQKKSQNSQYIEGYRQAKSEIRSEFREAVFAIRDEGLLRDRNTEAQGNRVGDVPRNGKGREAN